MDYFRKFLGIPPPQRYNDGYYYWGPHFGDNAPQERNDFEIFEYPLPERQIPGYGQRPDDFENEFREIERQFREMWTPSGGSERGFFEFVPRFFPEEFGRQPQLPAPKPGPKSDEVLDSSAVNSDSLLAIMEEDKNKRNSQLAPRHPGGALSPFAEFFHIPPGAKNFSRSVSIQTTRRPDGIWETRKVIRDGDGTEQVTVTEHPSGPEQFSMQPDFSPDQFFEPNPGHDRSGTSIFSRIFGGF